MNFLLKYGRNAGLFVVAYLVLRLGFDIYVEEILFMLLPDRLAFGLMSWMPLLVLFLAVTSVVALICYFRLKAGLADGRQGLDRSAGKAWRERDDLFSSDSLRSGALGAGVLGAGVMGSALADDYPCKDLFSDDTHGVDNMDFFDRNTDPTYSFEPTNIYHNLDPAFSHEIGNIHHNTDPAYSFEATNLFHNSDPAFSFEPDNIFHDSFSGSDPFSDSCGGGIGSSSDPFGGF